MKKSPCFSSKYGCLYLCVCECECTFRRAYLLLEGQICRRAPRSRPSVISPSCLCLCLCIFPIEFSPGTEVLDELISCYKARYAGVHLVQWHSEGISAFKKDELWCERENLFIWRYKESRESEPLWTYSKCVQLCLNKASQDMDDSKTLSLSLNFYIEKVFRKHQL